MFEAAEFFERLGFLPRKLFPGQQASSDLIFLDGVSASFTLSSPAAAREDDTPYYDWAWSSLVPYHLEVLSPEGDGVVQVRRWDRPGILQRYSLSKVQRFGVRFIEDLEKEGTPRGPTVIAHALRLFSHVRDVLAWPSEQDVMAINAFHALLLGAASIRNDGRRRPGWLSAETLGEALGVAGVGVGVLEDLLETPLLGITKAFLEPDPASGRTLEPSLMLHHAAGALYQEAHVELERKSGLQLSLFGTPTSKAKRHSPLKEIVYTPPGLARMLAKYCWDLALARRRSARPAGGAVMTIMDPACGSGVFLVEACLYLENVAGAPPLRLIGRDVSPRAVAMARLAVSDARESSGATGGAQVEVADALSSPWPAADIILMNPPFVAWEDMPDETREQVRAICQVEGGRPDLAMAFIVRAVESLPAGGLVAAVLPSSLLETRSGQQWRERLRETCAVRLIGRFKGNDIFPTALVEASVLVLEKGAQDAPDTTTMVISVPGGGDAALRAIRRGGASTAEEAGKYEVYEVPQAEVAARSWLPRSRALHDIVAAVISRRTATVGDIFSVNQGIRTGDNTAFVLSSLEYTKLSRTERTFFRPLAGNDTISGGRLLRDSYVFYPYGRGKASIQTEAELKRNAPWLYEHRLKPARSRLKKRSGVGEEGWWRLTRERSWQYQHEPKLVSAYFGAPGKFAFDEEGDFVVGQGYAWRLRGPGSGPGQTRAVAPAYLALFNSRRFFQLVSYFSYRVMGGQFDLSPRFVNQIPIPDFVHEGRCPLEVVVGLRELGEQLARHGAEKVSQADLDRLASEAYGVPPAAWPDEM